MKVEEALYSDLFECMMVETIDGLNESLDVESFECMMVETIDGFNKKTKDELEAVYPQAGEDLTDFQEKCRVSGSKAVLRLRCNVVFNEKSTKKYEAGKKKALEVEKPNIPRFVFDKSGAPRRNEEYKRQFQQPRLKTFRPLSDIPQEKWVEPVNHKGSKRPKWKVLDLEKEAKTLKKRFKPKGYVVSPNYKGKNPMTITQWRHYQRNKKAGKEASTSQLKPVETFGQKRQYSK